MTITVRRYYSNAKRSLGILIADEKLIAFTLEPPKAGIDHPRIPAGSYSLALAPSEKFSPIYHHPMINVMGVPGRSDILMHPGDFERDTLGCLLIGTAVSTDLASDIEQDDEQLSQSRDMYLKVVYPFVSKAISEGIVDLLVEDCDG